MSAFLRFCLLLQLVWLGACASTVQVTPAAMMAPEKASLLAEQDDLAWWQLRIKLTWPDDEPPDLSAHLLVAEQLVLPSLIAHEQQLSLWRIHRRAARDGAGNQFSLIFYSDDATAAQIRDEVFTNPLTVWLLDQGLIEKTGVDKRTQVELGQLEQTSDPVWPIEIQRSWPYFIMGASQAWLLQVQEISQSEGLQGDVSYPDMMAHYRRVDLLLNTQWVDYGQHAYLHHLSAVFGYQPVRIKGSVMRRF